MNRYLYFLILIILLLLVSGCHSKASSSDISTESESSNVSTESDSSDTSTESEINYSTDQNTDIKWIKVKAGNFIFGSSDDVPCQAGGTEKQVNVTLTHDFLLAQTELTQKQWTTLGYDNPSQTPLKDNYPVRFINFYEAAAWCNKLSEKEGLDICYDLTNCTGTEGLGCFNEQGCISPQDSTFNCTGNIHKYASYYDCPGYRLPTTAEWEYAAKAATTTHTYGGDVVYEAAGACSKQDSLEDIAWYCNNSGGVVHPVANKKANPWGFYDMLGNAMEWVDYFTDGPPLDVADGHPDEALTDPTGTPTGDSIDARGWNFTGTGCYVRPSYQMPLEPFAMWFDVGFRPARTVFK